MSVSWRAVALAAILAAVLAVYLPHLHNGYVFDDHVLVAENPVIRLPGQWREVIVGPFQGRWDSSVHYRPLRYLSYIADRTIWRADAPWVYRAGNLFWHLLATGLVFAIGRRLLGDRAALIGAALFALHPVQVESVGYISGRRDVLGGALTLAACYGLLRRFHGGGPGWSATALGLFALACLTKEMALALVPIAALLAWHGRIPVLRRFPALAALGLGIAVAAACYSLLVARASLQFDRGAITWYGGSALATALTSARIFWFYVKLMLWPQTLSADYAYDAFPISPITDWAGWLALMALAGAAILLVRLRRRERKATVCLAWFALALLPVMHLIPHHDLLAEHYLYLPSVGLCWGTGWLLSRLAGHQRLATGLALAAILSLASRSYVRLGDWRDEETLWRATLAALPRCGRAHMGLARALVARGDLAQAEEQARLGLAILPSADSQVALCRVLRRRERLAEAETAASAALRLDPEHFEAHLELGEWYFNASQAAQEPAERARLLERSHGHFRRALAREPRHPALLKDLGLVAQAKGDPKAAERCYREALQRAPGLVDARFFLATVLLADRPREAREELQAVLRQDPEHPQARRLLPELERMLERP